MPALDNANRLKLLGLVEARPGVGMREAGRCLGLATGQTYYHVGRLRDDGQVFTARYGHRVLLFPHAAPTGRDLARHVLLANKELARLHDWIGDNGPVAQKGIVNAIPWPRATIQHRLDRLTGGGIVATEWMGRERIYRVVP